MKYKIEFEHTEIHDCGNCPFADIERTMIWCNVQEVGVANANNERVFREGIAELMMNCKLERVGE